MYHNTSSSFVLLISVPLVELPLITVDFFSMISKLDLNTLEPKLSVKFPLSVSKLRPRTGSFCSTVSFSEPRVTYHYVP